MSKRTSSVRLAGWLGLFVILSAALAVTAFALTRSDGPKPPKRPLAAAIRSSFAGKPVMGVSADLAITQHLLPGASTLVSQSMGATGHVWATHGSVHLQLRSSQLGVVDATFNGRQAMLWDRKAHAAFVLAVKHDHQTQAERTGGLPSLAEIQSALTRATRHIGLSGAIPSTVAGRPAYTVRVTPRHAAGLLGAAELAWDSQHGTPLRFAIYPRGSSTPAIEIAVTNIRYGAVPASDLVVRPTAGTKIERVHLPRRSEVASASNHAHSVTGMSAVAGAVGFRLVAPSVVGSQVRTSVRSVSLGGSPAALVVYGRGLGATVVLEQRAGAHANPLSALPTATIAGRPGRELDTTLGTLVQFTRGGVTYTVAGFQPSATIVSAAGSLR
jgi:hypothetical protein